MSSSKEKKPFLRGGMPQGKERGEEIRDRLDQHNTINSIRCSSKVMEVRTPYRRKGGERRRNI